MRLCTCVVRERSAATKGNWPQAPAKCHDGAKVFAAAAASTSVISSGAASSANADIIISAASSASTFPARSNEPPTKKARISTRFTSAEAVEEAFR